MNKGCSQTLCVVKSPHQMTVFLAGILLGLLFLQSGAYAIGPTTAALGGTQVATAASGVNYNPAAVVSVERTTIELGAAYPFGTGDVGYLAFYEPKDPAGHKAALSGMLGVSHSKAATAAPGGVHTKNAIAYQMAEEVPLFGAFGVGVRYLQEEVSSPAKKASAWRLDVGWQGRVGQWLTIGVVGRDVVGTNLEWSNDTMTKRVGTLHAGVALNLGSVLTVAADFRHLNWQKLGETWHAGVTLQPVEGFVLRGGYRNTRGVVATTAGAGFQVGNMHLDVAATIESAPTGSLSISFEL